MAALGARPYALARPLAAVSAVVTAGVLPAFLTGALSVQVRRDLRFGEAALGVAVAAFFVTAAAASALLGRTAERLGATVSMRLGAALSALVLVLIAVAARSWGSLTALLAAAGLANAMTQPAANLFIARTVDPRRLGLAFAVKQAAVPAGSLLGGLAVPTVALTVGWRWAYVGGAVIAAVGALTVPAVRAFRVVDEDDTPARNDASFAALATLSAGVGLGAAAAATLGTFLVGAAVSAGMSEGPAGLLVAVGSGLGICVRLVVGSRADRREGGSLGTVAGMLVLGAFAYWCFAPGSIALIVAATPLAFGAGWGWPGLFNLAVVRASPASPAAASGITQTGTYIGAMVGPLLFGSLVEGASYAAAWVVAGGFALAAAVAVIAGRALVRRDRSASMASAT